MSNPSWKISPVDCIESGTEEWVPVNIDGTNEHLKNEEGLSSELGSQPRCQLQAVVAGSQEPVCPSTQELACY